MRQSNANRQSVQSISESVMENVMMVTLGHMIPGPMALGGGAISLVACAIRSPVGVFWKDERDRLWIWLRKSFRRSNSIRRDATIIVWRVRNVKMPAIRENPTTTPASV